MNATSTTADIKLAGWQVRYQQRSFWRNRRAAFFSIVFPAIFLVIFGGLNGGHLDVRGQLSFIDFYTPGIMAYAVLLICFNSTALIVATLRDRDVLKRVRTAPIPGIVYGAGIVGSMLIVLLVSIGVLFLIGVPLYGAHLPGSKTVGLFVTLVLGAGVFTTLGIAAAKLIGKPENGAGLIAVITLPMIFLSNIWFPIDGAPAWVQDIAKAMPLRPLADGMQAAFDPRYGGTAIMWRDLGPLIVWLAIGAGLMVVYLRSLSRRA
jgi:ABC-2 type transport system permease protein